MRTADDIVRQEIHACVSGLVATLAGNGLNSDLDGPLGDLCEQAAELTAPIPDYEEAARDAGWSAGLDAWRNVPNFERFWGHAERTTKDGNYVACVDAREACEHDDIDPLDCEVYEHWIVSDWLADKLEAKGEKVDRDFGGLIVWARTTTGQAISMDGVMQDIAADLAKQYGVEG